MNAVLCRRIVDLGAGWYASVPGILLGVLFLLMLASIKAEAANPATSARFDGQWQLLEDSDDIIESWHDAIREQMKRDARRVASKSPMARPANPGQHINLPMFLASFKRIGFHSASQSVVIEQKQFQKPELRGPDRDKFVVPDAISREINLHPEASSISLRESAKRPPTMFIGGWEKGALVIETTTDEGLLIEEYWKIVKDDDEEVLRREVRIRSSIWGEKIFQQQFEKAVTR